MNRYWIRQRLIRHGSGSRENGQHGMPKIWMVGITQATNNRKRTKNTKTIKLAQAALKKEKRAHCYHHNHKNTRNRTSKHPNRSDRAISQTESDDHINCTAWRRKESSTPPLQKKHRNAHSREDPEPPHSPSPFAPSESAVIHSQYRNTT